MNHLHEFKEEIAKCRTFVFLKEVKKLAAAGLIKGGDLNNAVVLFERPYHEDELHEIGSLLGKDTLEARADVPGVLNTSPLRYQNEPARHKLLDIAGDLALTGYFIQGHILAARPGHTGNIAFARILKKKIKDDMGKPNLDVDRPSVFDINQISNMLPHRYPFLLVDRVTAIDKGKSITGLKNVSINELFFQGHFPGNPILPGIVQLHWAIGFSMGLLGFSEAPHDIKRLKFKNIVQTFVLRLHPPHLIKC